MGGTSGSLPCLDNGKSTQIFSTRVSAKVNNNASNATIKYK